MSARATPLLFAAVFACASSPPRPGAPAGEQRSWSQSSSEQPILRADPACNRAPPARPPAEELEADPWLTRGAFTLPALDVFRKVIVQVKDNYHDPARIDPPRMLTAILKALTHRSRGQLKLDSAAVVASNGDDWPIPKAETIWQVPLILRDFAGFLARHVTFGKLIQGHYAETVSCYALLTTLDEQSMYLTPTFYRPGAPGPAPEAKEARQSPPVPEGIVYLRSELLTYRAMAGWRARLEAVPRAALRGIVLDLRGNSVGSLDAVIDALDLFIARGPLLVVAARDRRQSTPAHDDGLASEQAGLVVLTDAGTLAGAEMLAGMLRFSDRALLMGTATMGRALVDSFFDFVDRDTGDRSGLRLATAEALLPGDRSFNWVGIAPDIQFGADSNEPPAAGCAPVGDTAAKMSGPGDQPDALVAAAAKVLLTAKSGKRDDLIEAAKAMAIHP